jgi:uncharacterized protein (TIGR03905 family)
MMGIILSVLFALISPEVMGQSYQVVSEKTENGIRYVSATPSEEVCAKKIDIEIYTQDRTIKSIVFTRGCAGNAKGIGALAEGMKVEDAIKRLKGITCGKRPTSCPDQLARVLESLKW